MSTRNIEKNKIVNFFLILFIIFNFSFFIFNDFTSPDVNFDKLTNSQIETINENKCSITILDILSKTVRSQQDREVIYSQRNLNIFPEISNIRCIGMVTDVSVDYSNKVYVFIGTSNILFFTLEAIFLILIILGLLFSNNSQLIKLNLIIYIFGYISMYLLFVSELNIHRIFFPLDSNINNLSGYFFCVLYLSFLINKIKSEKFFLFYFFYFLFLFNEYFGIFIIVFFFFNIFNKSFELSNFKLLNFSIISFYILRLVSGIFSPFFNLGFELNKLWSLPTQRIYTGSGRYNDMYWNFASFKNVFDKKRNLPCTTENCDYILNGGPISRIISFNSNPHQAAVVVGSILIIAVMILYFQINKNDKNYSFLVLALFLSPPMNNLTFLGNDDLLIGLLIYFILTSSKLNYFIKNLLLFPMALFQIYPGIFYFSLFYIHLVKRNFKKVFISSIFLIFFVLINYYYFFVYEALFLFDLKTWQGGYGLSGAAVNFSNFFDVDSSFLYYLLILSTLIFSFINSSKLTLYSIGKSEKIFDNQILSTSLLFFTGFMLFSGTVYSLPLHFFYFYNLFDFAKNKYLKLSIILFVFLTPSIIDIIPDFIRLILDTIKDLAGIYIFVVSASIAFDSFIKFLKENNSKNLSSF